MSQPKAFQWLTAVLSERGPKSHVTKLVLAGVFQRVDWETGRGFFEGSRGMGRRLGLSKNTVTTHLELATNEGWLTRSKRATTDAKGNERSGYHYSLAFGLLSQVLGQKAKGRCPTPQPLLSQGVNAAVPPVGTYSPLNPLEPKRAPKAHQNLRVRLMNAAKRSYERQSFEADYPDVMRFVREHGGWIGLGQSDERKLPKLTDEILSDYRDELEAA